MFDVTDGTAEESVDELAALAAVARQVRRRGRPVDPGAMRGDLQRLRRSINLLEFEFAVVAASFAETAPEHWGGYVSPLQALRQECGMTGQAAASAIGVGSQAPSIPASVAALEDGRLGFAHLAVLAGTARALQDSPGSGGFDEHPLLDQALAHGLTRFRDDCAHVRHAHDAAAYLAEQREQASYRLLELHAGEGGTLLLKGSFDPVAAAAIRTALEPLARWTGAGDLRSRDQRHGDAFYELCVHGLDEGRLPSLGGQRPHLHVTTTVETLLALPGAPAGMLEHAGPIAAATVQRLACDASIARVVMGPDSVVTDVGRARRLPSAPTRRALRARDAGCVWPGCDRPPSWTSAHHLEHWGHGGATSLDNLVLLCLRHHTMLHEGGWQLVRGEHRAWVAISPLPGVEHRARPPYPP
jgi:hypothetical protein